MTGPGEDVVPVPGQLDLFGDPRLPGGERYACSVPGCEWQLTVPAPQVQGLKHLGGGAVLTVAEVPMPTVAAALAEHLATHDEGDLRAAMLAALRDIAGGPRR